jgi:hypothetical protein
MKIPREDIEVMDRYGIDRSCHPNKPCVECGHFGDIGFLLFSPNGFKLRFCSTCNKDGHRIPDKNVKENS